jgi:hypothetical protein
MAYHCTAKVPGRMVRDTLVSLAVVIAAVASPLTYADAAMTPTGRIFGSNDGNRNNFEHNGNGKFIRNNFSVNSPTFAKGNQHLFNQNVGGINPTQNAICKKKFRHCKNIQRLVIVDP